MTQPDPEAVGPGGAVGLSLGKKDQPQGVEEGRAPKPLAGSAKVAQERLWAREAAGSRLLHIFCPQLGKVLVRQRAFLGG